MTASPFIIALRAESVGDLQATFARIDARRMDWLAGILAECDRPASAQMAREWASEYRMLADRLDGVTPIGAAEDDAAVTASAIAFGGPLPNGRAA